MFDFGELFHVGVRVADLERAMSELADGGLTWSRLQFRQQRVWLPGEGVTALDLQFTYSSAGPVHVELLQGPPGSIWGADSVPGVHHFGVWVDEVRVTSEKLIASGWSLEAAQLDPEDGYGAYSYVRSPSGVLVEPVSKALAPAFEAWWAGGDL